VTSAKEVRWWTEMQTTMAFATQMRLWDA
jgi:hypothetical protein